MKKIERFLIVFIMLVTLLPNLTNAAELTNATATTDKTKVVPGSEVTVTVDFGEALGAYEVHVDYDDSLFDFISTDGGTEGRNIRKLDCSLL